jgi:hypothetical protein
MRTLNKKNPVVCVNGENKLIDDNCVSMVGEDISLALSVCHKIKLAREVLNQGASLLMYQFSDLLEYLEKINKHEIIKTLRLEIHNYYEKKGDI